MVIERTVSVPRGDLDRIAEEGGSHMYRIDAGECLWSCRNVCPCSNEATTLLAGRSMSLLTSVSLTILQGKCSGLNAKEADLERRSNHFTFSLSCSEAFVNTPLLPLLDALCANLNSCYVMLAKPHRSIGRSDLRAEFARAARKPLCSFSLAKLFPGCDVTRETLILVLVSCDPHPQRSRS
jgi:hypothetical protein